MNCAEKQDAKQLNTVSKLLSPFFFGKAFPIFIALTVSLSYVSSLPLLGLAVISICATFIFILYKDVTPIIPLLFMVVLTFRDYDVMNEIWAYIILMPAIASFVARFFIHPIKWTKPGKLFLPLILVTLAYVLGGVLRPEYDILTGIAYTISLGPTIIVVYLFFYYNIDAKNSASIRKYLCFTFVCAALVMILQIVFIKYVIRPVQYWELGWANRNAAAAFFLLAIPACYYLIVKSKNICPQLILLLVLYVGVVLSGSDATLLISIVYSPFLIYCTYRNIYRTKRLIFAYSVATVIIVIASLVIVLTAVYGFYGTIELLNISSSDSGRTGIYQTGVQLFKENPLFGYGFGYVEDGASPSAIRLFNFHSTLLHIMATMGLFGVVMYAIYFIARFSIFAKSNSPFPTVMLIAFVMFESYAMVDTGEFNAIPLTSAITVILTIVELTTKKGNANSALPLSTNKRSGYNF